MKFLLIVYLAAAWCFCLPSQAHAYIDPGTGSLILQAVVAVAITCMAFIRGIRERIIGLFRRDGKDKQTDKEE